MVEGKLNGEVIKIPTKWDDVTFKQFLDLMDVKANDHAKLISIFTGIPEETVSKAKIGGLENLMRALSFISTEPQFDTRKVEGLLGIKAPADITFEHLAPYEDMMQWAYKDIDMAKDGKHRESVECKARYCAIYSQYSRDGEYDSIKAETVYQDILNAPCLDVLYLGTFFLIKHLASRTNITASSKQSTPQSQKKKKQTSRHSTKRSARSRQ